MHFPAWTLVPFPVLVVLIAALPSIAPRVWARPLVQLAVVAACALPIGAYLLGAGRAAELVSAAAAYVSFVTTLSALYVTAGGVQLAGELEGTPGVNVALVVTGAALASVVGTTGASMLLVRPLLRANRRRSQRGHLVPFFIVAVANVGGLLTPLGDPPLLVGYLSGVPFFWTLRLLPAWALYVGSVAATLYVADRRAYAREGGTRASPAREPPRPELWREEPARRARVREEAARRERLREEWSTAAPEAGEGPLRLLGKRNVALMLAVAPAALLPLGWRETAMLAITAASLAVTPRAVRAANAFLFAPMVDVAIVFAGLFACLAPVQAALAASAPTLPLRHAWQTFWASGAASTLLDNAPTYGAFAALARGLAARGAPASALVAGIAPLQLAAVSLGTVVMGATTYLGNGPNLMIKAIAEHDGFRLPSFPRYAVFAFAVMLPAHLAVTAALVWLEAK